jgi:hypothetical protein
LYEDDGLTRAYQTGASARQKVDVNAPVSGSGDVRVSVGALTGSYNGKLASRGYEFDLHTSAPSAVTVDGATLTKYTTRAAYDAATSGWFFDGVLHSKIGSKSTGFTLTATGVTVPSGTPVTGSPSIPKTGWKVSAVDSQETAAENGAAPNAIDGKPDTMWHTQWSGTPAPLPHEITIDLGASYPVNGLSYLPRQDGGTNGRIGRYEVYVSSDNVNWGTAVAAGEWADTTAEKTVPFPAKTGRYLRLRALSEAGDSGPWTSAAEISATRLAGGNGS